VKKHQKPTPGWQEAHHEKEMPLPCRSCIWNPGAKKGIASGSDAHRRQARAVLQIERRDARCLKRLQAKKPANTPASRTGGQARRKQADSSRQAA